MARLDWVSHGYLSSTTGGDLIGCMNMEKKLGARDEKGETTPAYDGY